MSKEYVHFKGLYRGVFEKKLDQSGYGHQFSNLKWEWLELSKIERLHQRDFEKEKVADYLYFEEIKPRTKWGRGVDLMIELPDGKTYASPIFHVVMRGHAGERHADREHIRNLGSLQLGSYKGVANGEVYFSIPKPEEKKVVVTAPTNITTTANPTTAAVGGMTGSTSAVVNESIIPDLNVTPVASKAGGCLKSGCAVPLGCIGGFFKIFKWLLILSICIGLIQFLGGLLKNAVGDKPLETKKGKVQLEDQRLDPKQDTLAPQPWNYLVDHEIAWSDFKPVDYLSRYTTSTLQFADSRKMHQHWASAQVTNEMEFWHDLYKEFYTKDQNKLDSLLRYFEGERKSRHLNNVETAEMVVTFIQEIPYYLVHDGSCEEASSQGGFVADYHAEGKPCLAEIIGGVQSPYEFVHNLKGDCDTRSLLGYTLLSKLGIESSVWISPAYGHSILGVAVPVNSQYYKVVNGTRYFGVELTAKGFRIGMISPEQANMNNWNVVLN